MKGKEISILVENKLIKQRIAKYLGYGDPKSKIWLFGMEEVSDQRYEMQDYIDWFRKCEKNTFVDFQKISPNPVWEGKYNLLYRLLLFLEGEKEAFNLPKDSEKLRQLKENIGRIKSVNGYSNCLLEFNPIPYKEGTFFWKDYIKTQKNRYKLIEKIQETRNSLIKKNILKYKPRCIILYGRSYKDYFLSGLNYKEDAVENSKYKLIYSKLGNTCICIIPHCCRSIAREYESFGEKILEILSR